MSPPRSPPSRKKAVSAPVAPPRRALGRGLAALMPGPQASPPASPIGSGGGYRVLAIERLRPNKKQPRKSFAEDALAELTESIKVQGLLQPIVVRRDGDHYEIVAGERRWRAATRAGLTEVPCLIKELSDSVALQVALIENIQRRDLDPLEEAYAFRQLVDEHKLTHEELARSLGKSRMAVTNTMRLLKLPDAVIAMMGEGKLTAGHARALLPLGEGPQALTLARELVGRKASVRDAEARVAQYLKGEKQRSKRATGRPQATRLAASSGGAAVASIEEKLQRALGTRVRLVTQRGGKGHLEISYHSLDALDDLLDKLCPSY